MLDSSNSTTKVIYKLINPEDNLVFYIGKTSQLLSQRLKLHIFNATNKLNKFKNLEINVYIRNLLSRELIPLIEIVDDKNLNSETFYIKEYSQKYKLCNSYIGVKSKEKTYGNFLNFSHISDIMNDRVRPLYISQFFNKDIDMLSLNQKIELRDILNTEFNKLIEKLNKHTQIYTDILIKDNGNQTTNK